MITEGNLIGANSGVFACVIDGIKKTIVGNATVTGRMIHVLAGNPDRLETVSGQAVKENDDMFEFKGVPEFVTKNALDQGARLNPEHIMQATQDVVDPPHGATVEKVSAGEAADIQKKQDDEKKAQSSPPSSPPVGVKF